MEDNKQRNIVMNLRSKDVINGKPKLPTAEQLNFGEIAVNYAKGNETLSIKNDDNQIVEFSNKVSFDYTKTVYPEPFEKNVSDNNLHIEKGDQLNSVVTKKIESTISSLTKEIIDNEETTFAVVQKIAEGAGLIQTDGEVVYTPKEDAEYISQTKSLKEATEILDGVIKELKDEVIKDEKVTATSIVAIGNASGIFKTNGSIGFEKKENTNYIKNASSIYDALVILDAKIKEISDKIS